MFFLSEALSLAHRGETIIDDDKRAERERFIAERRRIDAEANEFEAEAREISKEATWIEIVAVPKPVL